MNAENKFIQVTKEIGLSKAEELLSLFRTFQGASQVTAAPTVRRASAGTSVKDAVLSYAASRKGNVWTVRACAESTGKDVKQIGVILSMLIRVKTSGFTRTGYGEYLYIG
jgi:hypothetical protein